MNAWGIAAAALLVALVPLGVVVVGSQIADALVAFELAGTIVVLVLVLLAEAFSRPSYFVVPLALAPLSIVGGLLFARFLPSRP